MWPFLNNITTTCEQNYCTPASSICYTGSNLSCIGVNQNDTLSVALQKINAVMCEPISSAKIIEALGYTPANDANVIHTTGDETKNGSLTVNDTSEEFGFGVKATSINGNAVQGESTNFTGVLGISTIRTGVLGISTAGVGVNGASTDYIGVLGESTDYAGVSGTSSNGYGVLGFSENYFGVFGIATNGIGIQGISNANTAGVFDTILGTKIASFLANSIEQAYILASGLFKANKILVNTEIDNGIDALQVDGTISANAATGSNQVVIKSQLDAVRPYKVYTALLTQTGTNAPTAVVLENTLGGSITFGYTGVGTYSANSSSFFTTSKTSVILGGLGAYSSGSFILDNSTITLTTAVGGVYDNGGLTNTFLEIRVYN
jgi:hypothetical protein